MSSSSRPVALVTGAATGVGRACAIGLARQGHDVVVNYSRSEAEAKQTVADVEALGAKSMLVRCDVSVNEDVRAMVHQIGETFGRLDCLINNAATTEFIEHSDLETLTEPMWDRILGVNLKGPFFVTRAAVALLREGDGGSVVNVSSVAGITGSGSSIAYCASKGGLNTLTKSLARSLAPKIRVNAVCPGPIDSRWIRQGNPNWDLEEMVADYPLPKASQPEDIADAVLFFATGTSMTTGQLLPVDGGQTLG
ncbi:SDR family NAD(P)-dependent oxidoreductase [Rhodopirellula europaea]|jgi:3-oxoacyl-[acyl-carrier protein] reductase|uniref:3-oxoacyl-[acyl-carrier-protein] reductase n=1 Tax=Rhodopirellula europaea SH398 TaxID=1263868 RepID=M5SRR1_9BACT|nr:SDR family oxidoreductase [Rhodopirellula europaea]EMI28959.1 3-oxoacyl-[acyl-carrier-protein] reductase [Rhodopirellula europaea SH398]